MLSGRIRLALVLPFPPRMDNKSIRRCTLLLQGFEGAEVKCAVKEEKSGKALESHPARQAEQLMLT